MAIKPIKLEITVDDSKLALLHVVATYADGKRTIWGSPKNLRGAKSILTKHANQLGMTKSKDGLSAE